jgi:hypothetical protein
VKSRIFRSGDRYKIFHIYFIPEWKEGVRNHHRTLNTTVIFPGLVANLLIVDSPFYLSSFLAGEKVFCYAILKEKKRATEFFSMGKGLIEDNRLDGKRN